MYQIHIKELPGLCAALAGGYYGGLFRIDGKLYANIVVGKEGELTGAWNIYPQAVEGARSYSDGQANTNAMVAAGSKLAIAVRSLRIGDFDDWHIPAQDQLEIIYRVMKPTTRRNNCYARAGINLSSFEATYPYTPDFPRQTSVETFKIRGAEAFEPDWYLSSTQDAAFYDYAWHQNFSSGGQDYGNKTYTGYVRPVRRILVIE